MICSVDGCGKKPKAFTLCVAHYTKLRRHGDPLFPTKSRAPGTGTINAYGYIVHGRPNGRISAHKEVAEKVLGSKLPEGAIVHHVNQNRLDNNKSNLVICPDAAYHNLLHQRMRALEASGHADWLKCRHCKKYDSPENLSVSKDRPRGAHKLCTNAYAIKNRKQRTQRSKGA